MIDISRIAHEHLPLKKVLMHRPEVELAALTEDTLDYFHFSEVPDIDRFLEEFDALVAALRSMGTEVLLVNDILKDDREAISYIAQRANMTYTRDLAIVTPAGGVLLGMAIDGRRGDPWVVGRAWERLGIPVLGALEPDGLLEGGGITYFRGDTVIIGRCDRTNALGLQKIEACMKQAGLKRMVTIPCYPGTIHIDGFFVLIDEDLAIGHPPRLDCAPATIRDLETGNTREQMMIDFLAAEGVDTIVIDERDGPAAANFVMTGPRQVVGYEWAERVMNEVERRGGRAIGVPGRELIKGNAGPHCMTLPLERGELDLPGSL
jgi:N-dimethylarginine dimethylaminohydrolase